MIPVVPPEEMREVDAAAPEPAEVLIDRAGAAIARTAVDMLGGTYGRRVVVVAGKGNNGADGRVAAARLRRRGVRVTELDAGDAPRTVPTCDLVVDAAYGTGFRGEYEAPDPGGAPVLAVDIPSGVDGLTGEAGDGAVDADVTVTFAALKPGLLLGRGPELTGDVQVVDIGLDVSTARTHLVEDEDVAGWLRGRARDAHKWAAPVWVVAGSPGMGGAAQLCAMAALRAAASTVRLGEPGVRATELPVGEFISCSLPDFDWAADVLSDLDRFKAIAIGPGLGRDDRTAASIQKVLEAADAPVLVDADGLYALGEHPDLRFRKHPTVLTPHEGEFRRLAGHEPEADRIQDVRRVADAVGATLLLKGPTTVVSAPQGDVLLTTTGGPQLATAGSGDVLAGIIAAFLAQGLGPLEAAAAGAHVHGLAGHLGFEKGLVAGDLLELVPRVLSRLSEG